MSKVVISDLESDIEVLDTEVERMKLRNMVVDWEKSKSIELASKICEMLANNIALVS